MQENTPTHKIKSFLKVKKKKLRQKSTKCEIKIQDIRRVEVNMIKIAFIYLKTLS